ncbi:hypothetical protein HJFPF1_01576 [Paramyrothecium foliicola]|nr:hypothetical protein HJFPF1_01576 [Paramyrothecium foliicola]
MDDEGRGAGRRRGDGTVRLVQEMNSPELSAAGLMVAPSAPDDCAEYMAARARPGSFDGYGDGDSDDNDGAATVKATCREVVGLVDSSLGEVQEGRRLMHVVGFLEGWVVSRLAARRLRIINEPSGCS